MARIIGLVIGGAMLALFLAIPIMFFGGAVLGGLLAIIAIPTVFPITTLVVLGFLGAAFLLARLRKKQPPAAK